MLTALTQAIAQLSDSRFQSVLWRGILGAILLYALTIGGLTWLLTNTQLFADTWLDTASDVFGFFVAIALSFLIFPATVTVLMSFLLEDVAHAVEARHYPHLPAPRKQPVMESVKVALRFLLVLVALNVMALPLYFIPGVNLVVFYLLNGYLLSREYYELVALRRLDPQTAKGLRKSSQGYLWLAGALIAFLLTIPVVNLVTPIIATAFMVHIFESLRRSRSLV